MPQTPSASLATLRSDLVEFFEFTTDMATAGYVGLEVLPVVETGLQVDSPGKVPLEALLFQAETRRNSGSNYNRGSFKFETFSYATKENGWEEPIDLRDEQRYRNLIQLEVVTAARAMGVVARNQEQRIADLIFNTTTWTGSALFTNVTHEWDDAVNCVPLTDVEAAVQKVFDNSGLWANALVVNRKVFRNLRNSAQVIDRIASSGAGSPTKPTDITAQMLAQAFDLEKVIVAGAPKNSNREGQSPGPSQIWSGEYAMVCRVATSADMREPCIGRTFHWSADGSSIGGTIEEYYEEQSRSRILRVRHDTDEVVMYPQAGHLLGNITT